MFGLRAIALGLVLLASCSKDTSSYDLDEWLPLLPLQSPVRFKQIPQAVGDSTCMPPQGIKVIGDVDATTLSDIIDIVRTRQARDAILMVRAKGRYAEAWTGGNCNSSAGGSGDIYHFRRDNGAWVLKESTQWVH